MPKTTNRPLRHPRRRASRPKPQLALELGLLDRWETAEQLGVDPSTVWRFATEGVPGSGSSRVYLRARRLGRALYFEPSDLDAFSLMSAEAIRKLDMEVA